MSQSSLSLLSYPGYAALSSCPTVLKPSYSAPVVADGWTAQLVVTGLSTPRSLLFDDTGALLVVESGTGIRHITFDDQGGTCLVVKKSDVLVANKDLNHGIELSADGSTLYASSANDVLAWSYDAGAASVGNSPQTLVTGMASTDHVSRTLLLSRDSPPGTTMLLVSRGSNANLDTDTADVTSGRSQIRAFDVNSDKQAGKFPYTYAEAGTVIGWGLRNSVGLAEEPTTMGLYSVENSVDDIHREGVDVHEDNPGEELNYHGPISGGGGGNGTTSPTSSPSTSPPSPSSSSSSRIGGNYGYPHCFALWGAKGTTFPEMGPLVVGDQFATDPNSTFNDQTCADDYYAPRLTFQAHVAPLDLVFAADGSAGYVSFHGSWDRPAPVGYEVVAIPFAGGEPVAASDNTTAAQAILSNADLSVCPGKCFRPVGLAFDSKGRLFVSSDSTGEIYVLQQTPGATTGGNFGGGNGGNGSGSLSRESSLSWLCLVCVSFILFYVF